jgi:glycosyltransferase involved in cell wall biosynthesis
MNIAWVSSFVPSFRGTGGFGLQGGNLIPLLARRHRVDLVTLTRPGDEIYLDMARRHCGWVETIPTGRPNLPLRVGNFISGYLWGRNLVHRREMGALLHAGLKERHWDILHVEGGFVAGLIPEDLPVPKVLAVHDAEVLRAQEMLRCKLSTRARLNNLVRKYHEPRYERLVYPRFAQCVMVAERDAAFNRKLIPQASFCVVPVATDCNFYRPQAVEKDPVSVVFHGNLSYPPNVEAALEFADHIMPLIRREQPEITFHLVGATPAQQIRDLASRPGIRLSANLPDLRSALCSAAVYVSALRHGTGVKNKILEAFASQLPIVCYEGSTVGIDCVSGKHLLVAQDRKDFAARVLELLREPQRAEQIARAGREFVVEKYSWEASAAAYEQIYERVVAAYHPATALCMAASLS